MTLQATRAWQQAHPESTVQNLTNDLWPDFLPARFQEAIVWFSGRDRRLGSSAPL